MSTTDSKKRKLSPKNASKRKEVLRKYIVENKPASEIAASCNMCIHTVYFILKDAGVRIRPAHRNKKQWEENFNKFEEQELDKETLDFLRNDLGLLVGEIASYFYCSESKIEKLLQEYSLTKTGGERY